VWGSVLVLALLAAVDPVRLGLTLLLISRPRPVQNLLAYGVGSPDSVYSHIGGSADAAARHTNV
jgi:Sap, sulfolipid-1-addressing protein